MPSIYSSTNDGQISKTSTTSWSDARDATAGDVSSTSGTVSTTAVYASHGSARGGGTNWRVYRSFFEFDTSGISVAPTDCDLKIYGRSSYTGDFFVVKSEQSNPLAFADFDAITGWSAGADNESNVTKYSSERTTWSSGYNTISLNSTALSDIASLDTFKICLINSQYDLPNTEPSSTTVGNGLYFANYLGTSRDPYIDYTAAATGYSHNVIGVDASNIGKVIDVATANISKVNDV